MAKANMKDLLSAGNGADLKAVGADRQETPENKLKPKHVGNLDPAWETYFDNHVKNKTFFGTYTAFIRAALVEKLKNEGF